MPSDLEQLADTGEAALPSETRGELLVPDRSDRINFYLAFFELVSPAGTNTGTDPQANASRDRPASNTVAQVFREQHRASLARCLPIQRDSRFAEGGARHVGPLLRRRPHAVVSRRLSCPEILRSFLPYRQCRVQRSGMVASARDSRQPPAFGEPFPLCGTAQYLPLCHRFGLVSYPQDWTVAVQRNGAQTAILGRAGPRDALETPAVGGMFLDVLFRQVAVTLIAPA